MATDESMLQLAALGREALMETDLPGVPIFRRGKVRDVYDLETHLLIVATDRISAFDVVLPTGIPDKGRVLNLLSAFWFDLLNNVCPSHFITVDNDQIAARLALVSSAVEESQFADRSMLVNKARPLPVEFVVRGYLDGSAWRDYQRQGAVFGITLPSGLRQGDRLPEPIFTPTTKAHSGHDQPITEAEMLRLAEPGHLMRAKQYAMELYAAGAAYALERGIILADTKFEFGVFQGEVILIDELFTPDSSRFWDAEKWEPGGPQASFDKQYVRDYLDSVGWNHEPPAPALPPEVVIATTQRYREIYRRLTGEELP